MYRGRGIIGGTLTPVFNNSDERELKPEERIRMQEGEYRIMSLNSSNDELNLNGRGMDGWELVAVVYDLETRAYFKRPKRS